MLRGSVDPKKPPVYEYVKFIGNFKSLANSEFLFFPLDLDWLDHMLTPFVTGLDFALENFTLFLLLLSVPNATRNGLEGILQRSLQPAFDDQVCFIATVRLAKPQFIKVSW